MTIIYTSLILFLLALLLWNWSQVKLRAKLNLWRMMIGLVFTTFMVWTIIRFPNSISEKASSGFIAIFSLTWGLWQRGLSPWGTISWGNSTKPYRLINQVTLTQNLKRHITLLDFQFGTIQHVKFKFSKDITIISEFLTQHNVRFEVK